MVLSSPPTASVCPRAAAVWHVRLPIARDLPHSESKVLLRFGRALRFAYTGSLWRHGARHAKENPLDRLSMRCERQLERRR